VSGAPPARFHLTQSPSSCIGKWTALRQHHSSSSRGREYRFRVAAHLLESALGVPRARPGHTHRARPGQADTQGSPQDAPPVATSGWLISQIIILVAHQATIKPTVLLESTLAGFPLDCGTATHLGGRALRGPHRRPEEVWGHHRRARVLRGRPLVASSGWLISQIIILVAHQATIKPTVLLESTLAGFPLDCGIATHLGRGRGGGRTGVLGGSGVTTDARGCSEAAPR